eukprot:CAMPEP_0117750308 /NCGR_PEP_ID=MMETSP0947-20121206/10283_1 /TAXON_ID=44440 /ORGANISM="Chattonella subsalsa, Strain CCMP2191" /LENGTH=34 /DNA_ID= /DNA_START= /DNA_END= /DNA_ORIENTATION=
MIFMMIQLYTIKMTKKVEVEVEAEAGQERANHRK